MDEAERIAKQIHDWISNDTTGDYVPALFHDRAFDGQAHTDEGQRGAREVKGITFRDVADCFVLACFEASGLMREDYPKSVYELPWGDIDPIAVRQRLGCLLEQRMRIYPDLPYPEDDPETVMALKKWHSTAELMLQAVEAMEPPPGSMEAALKDMAVRLFYEAK